ncbi:MAG: transcription antitermination factor NusB [Bacteroidota bacterium]
MLNRRTIRIKVMQSLFAYEQCCEADFELAKDQLVQRFSPDLNSMEVQDKALLKSQQQTAIRLLEQQHEGKTTESSDDPLIEKEVAAAMKTFRKRVDEDFRFLKKNTVKEIGDLEVVYHAVLNLIPALATVAAADKRGNHQHFINNPVIKQMIADRDLAQAAKKPDSGWDTRMDKVRSWFRDIVRPDAGFQQYNGQATPTDESNLTILKHLLRKLILGETIIAGYFEEQHIRWIEDREIIKGLAEKSLKSTRDGGSFLLHKLSLEWEEDQAFVERLFEHAAQLPAKFRDLIANNTKGWEVDRLPLTDRVILQMAIAEFTALPNVPIKVTINEYIELAKDYSTPKSRQFINGILDVIAKELKKSGDLKKSGRGLLDNK